MSENKAVAKGSKKGPFLEEKGLDCGLYFYRTGYTRSSCILYLAVYSECMVQF